MRNLVAKNDYNRAATHKSGLDYSRMSKHELYSLMEDEFMLEDWEAYYTEIDPPTQEVSKWDNSSRNHLQGKPMTNLANRMIGVLDIETGGTPGDCASTNILMPTFAFVFQKELLDDPFIIYGRLNAHEQLVNNAAVSTGTLRFWMDEAIRGTSAARAFKDALEIDTYATILVADPGRGDTATGVTSHNFLSNADAFQEVIGVINGMLENEGIASKSLRFYGNGPQFDMSIYESVSANSNVFDLRKPIVPWKFWDVASARNPRDYFVELGGNWKEVQANAEVWASGVIERYNLIDKGIYPVKHDPTFDALVESYSIKYVESLLKI